MNSVEFQIKAKNDASPVIKDVAKDLRDLESSTNSTGKAAKNAGGKQSEFTGNVRETTSAMKGARDMSQAYSQFMSGQFLNATISAAKGIKDLSVALLAMSGGAIIASILGIAGALGALFLSGQSAKVKNEEVASALDAVKRAAESTAESLAKVNAEKLDAALASARALADEWDRAKNAVKELQAAQDKLTSAKMAQELAGLGAEREAAMAAVHGDKDAERVTALKFDEREANIRNRYAKESADEAMRRAVSDRSAIEVTAQKSSEGAAIVEAQARSAEAELANRKLGAGADVFDKSGVVDKSKLMIETDRVAQEINAALKQLKDARELEKRSSVVAYGELPSSLGGGTAVMQSAADKKAYTAAWENEVQKKQQELGKLQSLPAAESAAAAARKIADEAARQNSITQQDLVIKRDVAQTNIDAAQLGQRSASSQITQTGTLFHNRRLALGATLAGESQQRMEADAAKREQQREQDAAYWQRAEGVNEQTRARDAASGARTYMDRLRGAGVPQAVLQQQGGQVNDLVKGGDDKAVETFAKLHAAWQTRDAKLIAQIEAMVRDMLRNNRNITTQGP